MQGTISKVSSFDFNGKTLWSFQLQGIEGYFRTGEKKIAAERGQYVTFDAKPGKNGSYNVDASSIVVKAAEKEASGVQVARSTSSGTLSKDDYWSRKEDRDLSVQKRIERQSTRNSALEFIKILLAQEAVKVPAKNKVEFLEELLAHYQEQFITDNGDEGVKEKRAEEDLPREENQVVGYV